MKKVGKYLVCFVLIVLSLILWVVSLPWDLCRKRNYYICTGCGRKTDVDRAWQSRTHWDCEKCGKQGMLISESLGALPRR